MGAYIGEKVFNPGGGKTLFWLTETSEDVETYLTAYLLEGIGAGEKLLLTGTQSFFEAALPAEIENRISSLGDTLRQIDVSLVGESGLFSPVLNDFADLTEFLWKAADRAHEEGYPGVRVCAEIGTLLQETKAIRSFWELCAKWDHLCDKYHGQALFVANPACMDPAIVAAILATQPQVGICDRIHPNRMAVPVCSLVDVPDLSRWLVHWFGTRDASGGSDVEDDLQKRTALFKQAIDKVPFGIWISDEKGEIYYGNRAAEKVWGGARFVGPDRFDEFKARFVENGKLIAANEWAMARAIHKGEMSINEMLEIEAFDGTRKTILNSAIPLFDEEHHVVAAVAINEDITEQRQIERDLVEVQHQLLVNAENERLKLAQDLHDGPIQDLYGVTFQVHELQEALGQSGLKTDIKSIQETLQQVISVLRVMCSEMRPPTLAPFGLEKAIRSHSETFHRRNPELTVRLDLIPDGQLLPEQVRMGFFRIYQELLNNVVRHAQASRVDVRFLMEENQAVLEVEDNGCGFNIPQRWVELVRQGHLGLVGLQERAEALGGSVKIVSAKGEGTQVRVVIPREPGGENQPSCKL